MPHHIIFQFFNNMRKTLFALLLAALCCQFTSAQTAAADTIRYSHYAYMKVKPGMYDDYLKLEKAWKKIHAANKKAGNLHDWSLAEMVSPSGASSEYDFVCRNTYIGAAALAASYESSYLPDNWKSLLTAAEIALVDRTGDIRTMVKTEVWSTEPQSVLWAADADQKARKPADILRRNIDVAEHRDQRRHGERCDVHGRERAD